MTQRTLFIQFLVQLSVVSTVYLKQKEQKAGFHMIFFLFTCPYHIPSMRCCTPLVGKTLEATSFSDFEVVTDSVGS